MASCLGWIGGEEYKDRKTIAYKLWKGLFVMLRCVMMMMMIHYLFLWSPLFKTNLTIEKKKKGKTEKSRPLASASFPNSVKTSSQGRCQMLKEEMVRSDVCFWKTVSETVWIRVDIYFHRWPNEHSFISQKNVIHAISWVFTTSMNIKLGYLLLEFHITLQAISPSGPLVGRKAELLLHLLTFPPNSSPWYCWAPQGLACGLVGSCHKMDKGVLWWA